MTERRSQQWYGGADRDGFIHRAWMRRGLPEGAFDGRPHIAIANTGSDLVPCNRHLGDISASVANGIWEAGGVPLQMPVMGLGETLVRPTAMLWRNLAAMAAEELFRANPIDGVVLLGGCDKTIPALLMSAASVDLPAIVVPGGPMLTGHFEGQPIGLWNRRLATERGGPCRDPVRGGVHRLRVVDGPERRPLQHDGHGVDDGLPGRGPGHDHPGHGRHPGAGQPPPRASPVEWPAGGRAGCRRASAQRRHDGGSFRNAIVTLAAIGGSTNAVSICSPIAGRLGIPLTLDDFDRSAPACRCSSTCCPPVAT